MAGRQDQVIADAVRQFGPDLGVGVGAGENHRPVGHRQQHLRTQQIRAREANEHVGTLDRVAQAALVGLIDELLLVGVDTFAAGINHAAAVEHVDVFLPRAHAQQQAHARNSSSTGPQAGNHRILQSLALNFQRVDHPRGGDYRSAVLVVVKNGDAAASPQFRLDFEALGCLDILEVDAAKSVRNIGNRVDEAGRVFGVDLDIHRVDPGKPLEQQRLAFHDRLARQ